MLREINIEGKRDKNGIIDIKVPESEKPLNVYEIARENIPVGAKITKSDVEVVKPQTDLDEYEDDSDIFEAKRPGNILKKYQEDVVKKDIEDKYSNAILTPEEESELKEKLFGQDKTEAYVKPLCEVKFEPEEKPRGYSEITFEDIAKDLIELHRKKNSDYGNAAHQSYKEFGIISYVIRLNDKLSRLKALTKPGATMKVQDESIIDTLKDLAAYAIMAIESLSTWK